jgi:hypothetical protein
MTIESTATPSEGAVETPASVESTIYAEDDQIVEALVAEHLQATGEAASQEDSDGDGQAPAPEAAPVKGEKVAYKGPSYKTGEEAVTKIVEAFESGDLDALAKATGKPKSFFKVSDAKWADFRKKEEAVRGREKAVEAKESNFKYAQAEATKEFGAAIKAAMAYQDGDYESFVTLVQELTKESYDEAQRKVIKGEIALAPEIKEERRKRVEAEKRLAELESKQPKPLTEEEKRQSYFTIRGKIEAELAGHAVSKIRGFGDLIIEKVRTSYSKEEGTYTMSAAEAADAVLDDKREEARALGLSVPEKKPVGKKPAATPQVSRQRAADARVPDGHQFEDDDDEIIADLKRQHALASRK